MTISANNSLSVRDRRPELMDQPGLDPRAHAAALRGLGRINALSMAGKALWSKIEPMARQGGDGPLRVLDVASGGGDASIALAARAKRAGLDIQVDGCDISRTAVEYAAERARRQGLNIRFFEYNALSGALPGGYDVVTTSLFLHHLSEVEAVGLLRRMAEAARRLLLVDDLIRGRIGYLLALLACHGLSRSHVVHVDGPRSVRGAYSFDEAISLARRAGLEGAAVTRHWPQRFLLSWRPG